jgi:hypothetical protein
MMERKLQSLLVGKPIDLVAMTVNVWLSPVERRRYTGVDEQKPQNMTGQQRKLSDISSCRQSVSTEPNFCYFSTDLRCKYHSRFEGGMNTSRTHPKRRRILPGTGGTGVVATLDWHHCAVRGRWPENFDVSFLLSIT